MTNKASSVNRASHNPDHLNAITRIIEPSAKLFLWTCGSSLLALMAWSIFGRIPYTIRGSAVFVEPNTINSLKSQVQGNIFFASDLSKKTRSDLSSLSKLIAQAGKAPSVSSPLIETKLVRFAESYIKLTTAAMADIQSIANTSAESRMSKGVRLEAFNSGDPIAFILDQATASSFLNSLQSYQSLSRNYKLLSGSANQLLGLYEKQLDDVKYLASIGVLPKSQVITAEQSVVTYKSNQLQSQTQLTNSLTGFTANLIKAAGGIQVMPTGSGVILSKDVKSGDYISATSEIALVSKTRDSYNPKQISVFVPVSASQGLKNGMKVLISPVNVDINKYGAIEGEILSLKQIPMPKTVANTLLGSESFASKAYGDDLEMISITVGLMSGSNRSKYKWSSSDGPPFPIAVGTEGEATVIVEYTRPISLVLPFLRSITGIK